MSSRLLLAHHNPSRRSSCRFENARSRWSREGERTEGGGGAVRAGEGGGVGEEEEEGEEGEAFPLGEREGVGDLEGFVRG